jgi:hypothetical protein
LITDPNLISDHKIDSDNHAHAFSNLNEVTHERNVSGANPDRLAEAELLFFLHFRIVTGSICSNSLQIF